MQLAKYSASGNDFVLFHSFVERDRSELARRLCDRHEGIGADGLIVLVPHSDYDFQWQFYNADGSEAEMCGNGSRAAAHYAYHNGLAPAKMRFLTKAGVIGATVDGDVVESQLTPYEIVRDDIRENDEQWWLIDTGVPHLVSIRDDIEDFDIEAARALRHRYNANVNIAKVENGTIYVRTYERGVEDETLACGTGMAACFVRLFKEGKVGESAQLRPKSDEELSIRIENDRLYFKGRVKRVFVTECEGRL